MCLIELLPNGLGNRLAEIDQYAIFAAQLDREIDHNLCTVASYYMRKIDCSGGS